jgi:hypothetical protein
MALERVQRGQLSLLQRPRPLAVRTRAAGDNDLTPDAGAGAPGSAPNI